MITASKIVEINKEITNNGTVLSQHLLNSTLSSYHYYENKEDQISSIFRGIIKNHAFMDGNKRTGFIVLCTLCEKYNIPLNKTDDELYDITIDIVNHNYDIEEISNKIFKEK